MKFYNATLDSIGECHGFTSGSARAKGKQEIWSL